MWGCRDCVVVTGNLRVGGGDNGVRGVGCLVGCLVGYGRVCGVVVWVGGGVGDGLVIGGGRVGAGWGWGWRVLGRRVGGWCV